MKTRKKRVEKYGKVFSVRIDNELFEKMEGVCGKLKELSRSEFIELAISTYLSELKKDYPKAFGDL